MHQLLQDPAKSQRPLSDADIPEQTNLNVQDDFKDRYLDLLYRYYKIISSSKTDIRHCKTYKHSLHRKDYQLGYQQQFPLLDI